MAVTARRCWQAPLQLPHLGALSAVTASAWAHPDLAKTLPAPVADEVLTAPFLQAAGFAGSTQQGLTAPALPAAAGANLPALLQNRMQPATDEH